MAAKKEVVKETKKDFDFTLEEIKAMNIYEKIMWAGKEAHGVEKDLTVSMGQGKGAYKATSDASVLKAVKRVESKYRILTIVKNMEIVEGFEELKGVKDVKMTTVVINVDSPEETFETISFGRGQDYGDKLYGKGSTYARKYALLNIFKLVTGEDPDQEASVEAEKVVKADKTEIEEMKKEIEESGILSKLPQQHRDAFKKGNEIAITAIHKKVVELKIKKVKEDLVGGNNGDN